MEARQSVNRPPCARSRSLRIVGTVTTSTPSGRDHTGLSRCRAQIATCANRSGVRVRWSAKAKNAATYGLVDQSSSRVGSP